MTHMTYGLQHGIRPKHMGQLAAKGYGGAKWHRFARQDSLGPVECCRRRTAEAAELPIVAHVRLHRHGARHIVVRPLGSAGAAILVTNAVTAVVIIKRCPAASVAVDSEPTMPQLPQRAEERRPRVDVGARPWCSPDNTRTVILPCHPSCAANAIQEDAQGTTVGFSMVPMCYTETALGTRLGRAEGPGVVKRGDGALMQSRGASHETSPFWRMHVRLC